MSVDELLARMRQLEVDHPADSWPAVRMADVSALCDQVQTLRVQLAHWRVFGEHAEGERSRLQLEVQALRVNARLNGQP